MSKAVSNTGPILALAHIGQLELVHNIFGQILIPPGVRAEILDEVSLQALTSSTWIEIQTPSDTVAIQLLREQLDLGESEAIVLATECRADWIMLDDLAARRKAQSIGLRVIGTLGLLLMAKQRLQIEALKPFLDRLRESEFRMSPELYAEVLRTADELE